MEFKRFRKFKSCELVIFFRAINYCNFHNLKSFRLISINTWYLILGTSYLTLSTSCADSPNNKLNTSVVKANGIFSFLTDQSEEALEPIDYISWVENVDNGLKVEKQLGNHLFTLQYKPLDYIVLKEQKKVDITQQELEKATDAISDLQYYTLQVSANGQDPLQYNLKGNADFQERIDYFSFRMQDDVKLVEGNDTLHCELYHFERTFGVTPYAAFLLAFSKGSANAKKTLVYHDKLLGVGTVKITIEESIIKNKPLLKLNT